jgi:N-acetylglucosamine kinase-like BadF-type ATPase
MTYLGIDGGGSKTTLLLVDAEDREIQRVQTGPTNWLSIGKERARAAILEGLSRLAARPEVVCGGFAGAARPEGAAFYTDALKSAFPNARIIVKSDAFVSYIGALGITPGVLLIAGTGSIAIGRSPDGSMLRAGGWGPHFGDEGSGFWIGREAVRAALRSMDRNEASQFSERIARALGLDHISDLPAAWSAGTIGVPVIADLFREVVRIYPAEPANRILRDASAHLSTLTTIVVERVGQADCPKALSGSVASHPTIRSLLGGSFQDPRYPPERGAIIWARSALSENGGIFRSEYSR